MSVDKWKKGYPMKKNDKIYDSPEYKEIKENLPEILKELESKSNLQEYQMPEGWNEDFEKIFRDATRKERRRVHILSIACVIVLMIIGSFHIGEMLEGSSLVVIADDIKKIHKTEIEQGDYEYSLYGNSEDEQLVGFEENDEIVFSETILENLNTEMKAALKIPFFTIHANLDDGYTIKDAIYNKIHRNLNYRIEWEKYYIYVSQQMQVEETSKGTIDEISQVQEVYVENLQEMVPICSGAQDENLNCNIQHDKTVLFLTTNLPVEEFAEVVASIQYQ